MKHLQRDLHDLKKDLLQLGKMVELDINNAMTALNTRNNSLAEEVIHGAKAIDDKEVEIEENCLKILALHQPVAVDLRFIVVALKVNNDLERMGDFAVNIAHRALFLSQHQTIPIPQAFTTTMTSTISAMVNDSLNALVELDKDLAQQVIASDDQVDAINRQMYADLQQLMRESPDNVDCAVQVLSTSRYMERIADLATNIAEDVIFMIDGEVIRHR